MTTDIATTWRPIDDGAKTGELVLLRADDGDEFTTVARWFAKQNAFLDGQTGFSIYETEVLAYMPIPPYVPPK